MIVALLGEEWPDWVQGLLARAFLVVGYALVVIGLRRYHGIAGHVERQDGQRLAIVPAQTLSILAAVPGIMIGRRAVLLQRLLIGNRTSHRPHPDLAQWSPDGDHGESEADDPRRDDRIVLSLLSAAGLRGDDLPATTRRFTSRIPCSPTCAATKHERCGTCCANREPIFT